MTEVKDEGIPEKIWVHPVDISLYKLMFEKVCDMDNEYILKSVADEKMCELEKEIISTRNNSVAMCIQAREKAIKPIVEVYEKYKDIPLTSYGDSPSDAIGCRLKVRNLWQAIKETVKRKEIETS